MDDEYNFDDAHDFEENGECVLHCVETDRVYKADERYHFHYCPACGMALM